MRKSVVLYVLTAVFTTVNAFAADQSVDRDYVEMDAGFAEGFAQEWVDDWNAHDLERILSHYEDDFEMSSPSIRSLYGEASGKLKGKEAIGDYWALALERNPTLHFELLHVLTGAQSITLVYNGVRGLAAETFVFSTSGKVSSAYAHYE